MSPEEEKCSDIFIYDRVPNLTVREQDVCVIWSEDLTKVGVLIWKKMRGIINLATDQEGRIWLENRDTPGIDDSKWMGRFRV